MNAVISQCRSCSSSRFLELNAEMCLHVPGLSGLNKPPIFAFTKLSVCLDRGSLQSNLSEKELAQIRESAPKAEGTHG